jgi:hypothetical protein
VIGLHHTLKVNLTAAQPYQMSYCLVVAQSRYREAQSTTHAYYPLVRRWVIRVSFLHRARWVVAFVGCLSGAVVCLHDHSSSLLSSYLFVPSHCDGGDDEAP